MSNAPELAAELRTIATAMRELGVVRLKTEKVEIELGAPPPLPPANTKREMTDMEFALAATEGFPETEEEQG